MDNDHEQAKYAANHYQAPRDLMRALILFSDRADFAVREQAQTD